MKTFCSLNKQTMLRKRNKFVGNTNYTNKVNNKKSEKYDRFVSIEKNSNKISIELIII